MDLWAIRLKDGTLFSDLGWDTTFPSQQGAEAARYYWAYQVNNTAIRAKVRDASIVRVRIVETEEPAPQQDAVK
jgi:hypothetical protein